MTVKRIPLGFPISGSPVIADVDSDGEVEICVGASQMHVVRPDGRPLAGWPRRGGGPFASTPAVGDHIAIGSDDDSLYLFDRGGNLAPGFPFRTGGDIYSSPTFLTRDGEELVTFGSDDGKIYLVDSKGRGRPGWPFDTGDYVSSSPLVCDINGDGIAEIVAGSWNGRLYALDLDGRPLPGWPQQLGHFIWSSPAAADIDGDGRLEIVAAAEEVYAFRTDGSLVPGFPVATGSYMVSSPALADLDGDGRCEIWIGAEALYAIDGSGRVIYRGHAGRYCWASPTIADFDGDGQEEIAIGTWGGALQLHKPGVASSVLIQTGAPIFASTTVSEMRTGGSVVVAASWDGALYVLRLSHRVDPASWPAFHRGPDTSPVGRPIGRTGYGLAPIERRPIPCTFSPLEVEILPRAPRIGQPSFVRLWGENPSAVRRAALCYLHPQKNKWMRAPVVNDRGLCALVQPFFEPGIVHYYLAGENTDGRLWRMPASGYYDVRVDRPFHTARRFLREAAARGAALVGR